MNASLITDLEAIRGKLGELDDSESETVNYEIEASKRHIERAIEWEKNVI